MLIKHEAGDAWAIKCDWCGQIADWADRQEDAPELAWASGYEINRPRTHLDLCPSCQDQELYELTTDTTSTFEDGEPH